MMHYASLACLLIVLYVVPGAEVRADSHAGNANFSKGATVPVQCPSSFRIAAGGKGTAYYLIGQELANQIRRIFPGCATTVIETAGGVENLSRLRDGQADIVLANSGLAWDASVGHPRFASKPIPIRTLATLLPNTMHLVVSNASGIKRLSDLRGKRVSTGSVGSGTEVIASSMLQGSGMDWDSDIARFSLSLDESLIRIREGKIDAFIFGAAVPVAPIAELMKSGKFHVVPTAGAIPKMNVYGRIYREGVIPPNTYSGHTQEIRTLDVWDTLIVGEHFSWQAAHALTKTLFENKDAFVRAHKSMTYLDISAQSGTIVALHLGAQRYLAEQGVAPFSRDFGFIEHGSKALRSERKR